MRHGPTSTSGEFQIRNTELRTQSPRSCLRSARARSGAEGACPPGAITGIATTGTSAIGFSDGAGASSCDAVMTAAGAAEASAAAGRAQQVSIGPAVLGAAHGAEAAPPIVIVGQQQLLHASAATGVASATTRSAMPRRTMRLRYCITLALCTRATRPRHPPGQDLLLPHGTALDLPTLEQGTACLQGPTCLLDPPGANRPESGSLLHPATGSLANGSGTSGGQERPEGLNQCALLTG